jgi:phosphatidylglycerol:prolipoprotein diacylglycerol transferase
MNYTWLLNADNPHITIFGFDIYAYAIIIVCGMIAAFFVISLLFRRRNMSADLFLTFFCICLPIAILTTRLFYCITSNMPIEEWFSFESIRQGGLSIIGGIIGGAASVIGVCIVKKVNFFRAGDCIVVGLLLAQCIGRWGNFANQEVYGMVVDNPALQWFPFAVFIDADQSWHYAFFFYESMVTGTAAVLLFLNAWKNPNKPNGVNTACYFITYGLIRSIMEPLRDPTYILGKEPGNSGIPWSFVFSLVLLAAGIGLLLYVLLTNKKKEGKLFGSLEGDSCAITQFIGDKKDEKPKFDKINMMCKLRPELFEQETNDKAENDEINEKEDTI